MESLLDLPRVLEHTSSLIDAKRYDDIDLLCDDLDLLHESVVRKIFEIQRCLKCKKESTEYLALSRADNETEICPECWIKEAMLQSLRSCKNR